MGRDRIEQSIVLARRRNTGVAVLFVDMDNFKAINDSLGHQAGDEFLKIIALRLLGAVRESDSVIRHGGDEFVIAMDDVQDSAGVAKIASAVMAALAQPLVLRGTEVAASCSIGISMFPADAEDYENLLRLADIAMYQAKQAGRNSYQFYDPVLHSDNQTSLHLIASIRTGLANHEFVNFYQPVYDAGTGALIGAEALVRWQHPEMGVISPIQFIGAAEKSGLVVEMGQFVLFEACRQMAQWNADRQSRGLPLLTIAVNLSPVQFRRAAVETLVEEALRRSGLPAACLELEITESTLVEDTERFMASLQRIKALGPSLSIDDFGTGYSNLAYLQRFAVHKLKIDQSFVKDLLKGTQQRALVSAIIQLAKSLNLVSHAEGVENLQTLQTLQQMGCDFAQGYYFAKPESAEDFARRLA
jgi:diguanylate cyclase (GGDEF)-like protein